MSDRPPPRTGVLRPPGRAVAGPARAALIALIVALVAALAGAAPGLAQTDGADGSGGTGDAAVETLPLEAFYGVWKGTGISEDRDQLFFSMSDRDMDVDIFGLDEGFRVRWTTVIRTGDPNAPDVRRRTAELTFEPTDRPGLFGATGSGNPLEGGTLSWARIQSRTLSIYQMALNAAGGFDITHYDRTLDEEGGMSLVFRRLRDGEAIRTVRGSLSREGERP